jgi:aconitase B
MVKLYFKMTEKQRVFNCEILIIGGLNNVRMLQKFQIFERTFELINISGCLWIKLLLLQMTLPQV